MSPRGSNEDFVRSFKKLLVDLGATPEEAEKTLEGITAEQLRKSPELRQVIENASIHFSGAMRRIELMKELKALESQLKAAELEHEKVLERAEAERKKLIEQSDLERQKLLEKRDALLKGLG